MFSNIFPFVDYIKVSPKSDDFQIFKLPKNNRSSSNIELEEENIIDLGLSDSGMNEKVVEEPTLTIEEPTNFTTRESFVNYFIPLYEKALSEKNLPTEYAKYLVGQIALESTWGKKPAGWVEGIITNNYMGEKVLPNSKADGIFITTHEEDTKGNRYKIKDKFRKFKSIKDMVDFHVWKFTQGRWVDHNIYDPNDVAGFARRVKAAGYATGKDYVEGLNSVVDSVARLIKTKPETETKIELLNGDIKSPGHIVISKEDMNLKVYDTKGRIIYKFPIAVGKNFGNKKVRGDMKTPEGEFSVQQIQPASSWTHDFKDGKGEIKGAYGDWFIRLLTPGHTGIGIHGTHDPNSIGTRATEGCIRLRNEDLNKLKPLISRGMRVVIESSQKDAEADGVKYVRYNNVPKYSGVWAKPERNRTDVPITWYGGVNIGHMQPVIDLLNKYGIKYRLTSGKRGNYIGNSGGKSWHLDGHAIDISAPTGMSNDAFISQFVGNTPLLNELKKLNYGILNEYIPEVLAKTGGTGGHLHIGPDNWAWNMHSRFYNPNMPLYSL